MLGIVVFDLYNEYFARLLMSLEQCARREGYSTISMFSHKDLDTEIGCLNQLSAMGVDGIVLCPLGRGEEYESYIHSLHVPVVTVGNRLQHCSFVGIHDRKAMYDSVRYVLNKGYDHLIYYSPPLSYHDGQNLYAQEERYAGFLDSARQGAAEYRVIDSRTALSELYPINKTAVVCSTDYHAIEAYSLLSQKYRIPDELGLIGFDDTPILRYLDKKLSSVGYDVERVAEFAIEKLFLRQSGARFVEHCVIPRESL